MVRWLAISVLVVWPSLALAHWDGGSTHSHTSWWQMIWQSFFGGPSASAGDLEQPGYDDDDEPDVGFFEGLFEDTAEVLVDANEAVADAVGRSAEFIGDAVDDVAEAVGDVFDFFEDGTVAEQSGRLRVDVGAWRRGEHRKVWGSC